MIKKKKNPGWKSFKMLVFCAWVHFSLNSNKKNQVVRKKKIAAALSDLLHFAGQHSILACKDGGDPQWCQLPSG